MQTKRGLIILGAGLCGAVACAIVFAQSKSRVVIAAHKEQSMASPSTPKQAENADRQPLSYYTVGVRGDLFNPGVEMAPPKPLSKPKLTAAPKAAIFADTFAVSKGDDNPLADYVYSGTVEAGGNQTALIENGKTQEGDYFSVGDDFHGLGKISSITPQSVSVLIGGTSRELRKNSNYSLTPLTKSAAYLQGGQGGQNGQNGPGGPGQPGMDQNGMPGGMGGGMPGMPGGMPGGFNPGKRMMRGMGQGFQGGAPIKSSFQINGGAPSGDTIQFVAPAAIDVAPSVQLTK